ncbi:MAG TPA: GNAT family N-acetyltransferase [Amnibacterium sp.]|jgi:RimJ/RimL family protein N-acetyltransferase
MTPVVLRTPRLVLDLPGERDVATVFEYCQDPVLQRYTTVPVPYRREDAATFLLELAPRWWEEGTEQTWAIRLADVPDAPLLGVIGLRSYGEVGYWMGAEHRGNGYLGEAFEVVIDHWFRAGNERMTWSCLVGNVASARAARRAGFHFTGTGPATVASRDGSHPDSWLGELFAGEPREPRPGWPAEVGA